MEGTININGVIGLIKGADGKVEEPNTSLKQVILQVEALKDAKSFVDNVESPGGLVEEADDIYNYLKSLSIPVNTRTSKICASAATKVFLAGERREIVGNPDFLIHNPFGKPKEGDADYMEAYSQALRGLETEFINFYSSHTGSSKEAIKPLMKRETFLTPEEAVSLGFATHHTQPVELQAVAYSDKLNLNNNEMSKEKEVDAKVNSILEKITNFLTGPEKPQAKIVQDATGTDIDFYELEEDATPSVGDKARINDAAATGEHVMPDGETYVFTEGELTEIKSEETDEEVQELKEEIQELKDELAQAKALNKTVTADLDKNQEGLKEIQKEIKALKSSIGSGFKHEAEKKNYQEPKQKVRTI